MAESSLNNKRIAKNTFLLYVRMLFQMLVSLYTSRILLQALGISDYGIYNVVGGIVALFSFVNASMSSATQRFLTFSLGKGDKEQLKNVFGTAIHIHIAIALIILILSETIGLWFLYNKMVIPDNRLNAAIWVFHCSVITVAMQAISLPFNALIIAHEKMSAFAYISILSVIIKLGIVYMIILSNFDRLIFYAILMMMTQFLINVLYVRYCNKQFEETHNIPKIVKPLLKEMSVYAGWNLWGTCAVIFYSQGLNVLLNIFFGPAVNAARGVSVQVNSAVNQFSSNFLMAVNPQITKTYASGETHNMFDLINRSSKFTFFLLFVLSFPIILETDTILGIWLVEVPNFSAIFLKISLVIAIFDGISTPLMQAVGSTGRIAIYQTVIGGLLLLILPVSYIMLKMGYSPISVYLVHLSFAFLAFLFRLKYVAIRLGMNLRDYYNSVILKIIYVLFLSTPIPYLLHVTLSHSLLTSFSIMIAAFGTSFISVTMVGLDRREKQFVVDKIASLIHGKEN